MPYKDNNELIKARETARDYALNSLMSTYNMSINDNELQPLNDYALKSATATQKVNAEVVKKGANTGYEVNPPAMTTDPNGVGTVAALRRESIASMVRNAVYGNEEFIFYQKLMENPLTATSTVEQYVIFDHHRQVGHGLTNLEGAISKPTDPHMIRKAVPMKYISVTSNATIVSTLVNSVADPIKVYNDDAITTMISMIEWQCFYGDADLSASPEEKNGTEFDGLDKLIPKENVIDNRGKTLDGNVLSAASRTIQSAYGVATDAFMPAGAKAQFVNTLQNNGQLQQVGIKDNHSNSYEYGYTISGYNDSTTGRLVNLNGSNVMTLPQQFNPYNEGTAGSAITPTVTATADDNDGKGKFRKDHEVNQALNYKVVSVVGSDYSTSVDVAATVTKETGAIKLEIALKDIGINSVEYVSVYRQGEDGYFWLLKRIGIREADENGKITFVDRNEKIAGTVDVFVGDMRPDTIGLYQLLPIDLLPLAQLSASYNWTYLWFGALGLFLPKRWVKITNVATLSTPAVR